MKQSLVVFLATFTIAFVVYAVLRQDCFYRHDGWGFVTAIESGEAVQNAHPLYLPMARLWWGLLAPSGIGSFAAAGLFSAFGTALAVAVHVLALRRLGNQDWILVAAWTGLSPAVLFFSTVVEIHGIFLAFAALSFYLTVLLVEKKSLPLSALLGLSLAIATGVHASGVLLPLLYLPWYLWRARGTDGRIWPTAALAALLAWTLPKIVLTSVGADSNVFQSLSHIAAESHRLLPVLWTEWLWPFFPSSILVGLALASKKWRVEAAILLLCLVPYVLVCMLILQEAPELGAYLLPWIFPASALCLGFVGSRLGRILVLASVVIGLWGVTQHEGARGVDRVWGQAVADACGEQTCFVLVWEDWEMDSLLLTSTQDKVKPLFMRPYAAFSKTDQQNMLAFYGVRLPEKERVFLSAATQRGLADPGASSSGPMILDWIRKQEYIVLLNARGQRADLVDDPKDEDR